jgi:four helix bundle protein
MSDVMDADALRKRTKEFAIRVLRLIDSMPRGRSEDILANQLARAATSVGANYRAACKSRSRADFISKITIVEEEADESQYWLELLSALGKADEKEVLTMLEEARELTAIFTASGKTAKRNK